MAQQQITISVPDDTFGPFKHYADREQRSLEEAVVAAMQSVLRAESDLPDDWRGALEALVWLDTATLRQIVERGAETEEVVLLKALSEQRQQAGAATVDEAVVRALIKQHDRAVLIRAKALALLRQHGEDISAFISEQ